MTFFLKKIICILSMSAIAATCFSINASASQATDTMKSATSYGNEIICVAHRGDWHSFPENSVEAINAAYEYNIVSVDVKLTSDNQAVLMADDTLDRMCVNANGETVSGAVSSFTLEEITALFLRDGNGGVSRVRTNCHVAALKQLADATSENTVFMLNIKSEDYKTVYQIVKELDMQSRVMFRIDESNKKIIEDAKRTDSENNTVGNYQGNIVFLASGVIKNCFDNGINIVELGSANGHGVLYDNFLMKKFDNKGRAMVSMVNGRCGKRTDNETGWDDLIKRGYSVIETDYPKELKEYIDKTKAESSKLDSIVDLYKDTDLNSYTTDTENALTSALKNADSVISSPSSFSEVTDARYKLQSAYDNLKVGTKKPVTLSFSFSAGRIVAAVLCVAAIIFAQIFFFNRRSKKAKTVK